MAERTAFGSASPGRLLLHLLGAAVAAGVAVLLIGRTGIRPDLVLVVAAAILVALTVEVVVLVAPHLAESDWPAAAAPPRTELFHVDGRTRRLADTIADARPGVDLTSSQLAREVLDVATDRLVRRRGADPADPLALAEQEHLLSAPTLAWLRQVQTDPREVGPCPTHVLRARLTEVSSL